MNEKSARKLQLSRRIDGIHPAAAWSIRVASIVFALQMASCRQNTSTPRGAR